MISRREFTLAALGILGLPYPLLADLHTHSELSWEDFLSAMQTLSSQYANKSLSIPGISNRGMKIMQRLGVNSDSFAKTILDTYESGNQFWLWQRLVKERELNGGILHLESQNQVPLHDHPQAIGMLRILSGEAEVWQFDKIATRISSDGTRQATLQLLSHKILKPGDTAILTPAKGNIHTIKSITPQCSMLDFFIPPYRKNERSWYTPISGGVNKKLIHCKQTPEHEYSLS